jgi:hypothetical protein
MPRRNAAERVRAHGGLPRHGDQRACAADAQADVARDTWPGDLAGRADDRVVDGMTGRISTWLAWSVVYFLVTLAVALVAHGTDLDQLTGRSAVSRAAAAVDRLLWGPYQWIGRQLGPQAARMPGATPALLVANALAWGAMLATVRQLLFRRRRS